MFVCKQCKSTSILKQNVISLNFRHSVYSQANTKMIPNGYLMFEDENFIESSVAKLNALRKSGQFCDVRLQVAFFCPCMMVECGRVCVTLCNTMC